MTKPLSKTRERQCEVVFSFVVAQLERGIDAKIADINIAMMEAGLPASSGPLDLENILNGIESDPETLERDTWGYDPRH